MLFVIVRLDETIDEVLEAVWYGSFCSVGSGGRPGWLDRPLAVLPTTAQRDATRRSHFSRRHVGTVLLQFHTHEILLNVLCALPLT